MSLITFTSDYGDTDHYVAAVKAVIHRADPQVKMMDICHKIKHFDIAHGAFVLRSVYPEFPEGTIHLVAVDSEAHPRRLIAVKLQNHYFLGVDNGLISLLSEEEPECAVVLEQLVPTTFAIKDVLAPAAVALSQGLPIEKLGSELHRINRKLPRSLRASRKQINGNVIRVNHYGNLITNIDRATFETLSAGCNYQILFGRESAHRIHQAYHEVDLGECVLLFNSLGLLELSINHGSAHDLLGLDYDSPVIIRFEAVEVPKEFVR